MDTAEIIATLERVGAYLKGHFVLSSGLHSDTYIQCAKVLEYPKIAAELCTILASHWKGKTIDVVAGPAYGGILISYELARQLGCRSIFFERADGRFTLRREFRLAPKERVLVSEDVVTTGGSAKEVIALVRESGATVVGVTSLINRNSVQAKIFDDEFHSLVSLTPPTYKPEVCPLCQKGVPVSKPGSRGLS